MGTQIERPIESTSSPTVGAAFYSLLDAVDSESIATDFEIDTYTATHDFDNHLKVAVFEGVHPSDSLDDLAEKTDTHEQVAYMAGSTFSRLTKSFLRAAPFTATLSPTRCPTQTPRLAGVSRCGD